MGKQDNAFESSPGERIPFKDLTNKYPNETMGGKQGSGTNWYSQMSDEKKEEHLKKQWIAGKQIKIAALSRGPFEESSQIADQSPPSYHSLNKKSQNLPAEQHQKTRVNDI